MRCIPWFIGLLAIQVIGVGCGEWLWEPKHPVDIGVTVGVAPGEVQEPLSIVERLHLQVTQGGNDVLEDTVVITLGQRVTRRLTLDQGEAMFLAEVLSNSNVVLYRADKTVDIDRNFGVLLILNRLRPVMVVGPDSLVIPVTCSSCREIEVHNVGQQVLDWSLSLNPNTRITVQPLSGSVQPNAFNTLQVGVRSGGASGSVLITFTARNGGQVLGTVRIKVTVQ